MVHGIAILASNPLVAHSIQLLVIFPLTCPTYPYRNPMKSLEIGMSYPDSLGKSQAVVTRSPWLENLPWLSYVERMLIDISCVCIA